MMFSVISISLFIIRLLGYPTICHPAFLMIMVFVVWTWRKDYNDNALC